MVADKNLVCVLFLNDHDRIGFKKNYIFIVYCDVRISRANMDGNLWKENTTF